MSAARCTSGRPASSVSVTAIPARAALLSRVPGLPADDGGLRDLAFGDEPGALADQCLLEDPDLRQDRGGSRSAGVRREQAPRVAVVPAAVGDGDPLETRPERGAVPGSTGVAGGGVQGLPHEDQRLGGVAGSSWRWVAVPTPTRTGLLPAVTTSRDDDAEGASGHRAPSPGRGTWHRRRDQRDNPHPGRGMSAGCVASSAERDVGGPRCIVGREGPGREGRPRQDSNLQHPLEEDGPHRLPQPLPATLQAAESNPAATEAGLDPSSSPEPHPDTDQ